MSTFPDLEAALEAAAHRHYGRRRRRLSWRALAPAVAVAAAAAAMLVALPARTEPPARDGRPRDGAGAHARALPRARRSRPTRNAGSRTPVAHAELAAVAADLRREIPYPPGLEDRFDWAATPPGPYDMASINHREEVQMLLEFRAGCLWLRYWLAADAGGPGGGRRPCSRTSRTGRTGGSPPTARAGRRSPRRPRAVTPRRSRRHERGDCVGV